MPQTDTSEATQGRIDWIDAAKGLGIALIVVGHVFSAQEPSLFYQYLYAFHVPLFFFVTGVTLRVGKDRLPQLVRKKLRTVMVPYVVYAGLGYLFYVAGYLLNHILDQNLDQFRYGLAAPLIGILWGTVGSGNLVNSPVWFLPALFWTTLAVHELNHRIASIAVRTAVLLGLTTVGCLMAERIELPMSLVPALLALPFLQAGYMYRNLRNKWGDESNHWLFIAMAAVVFAFSPVNGFSMQSETVIGNAFLFYLFAFAGIVLTIGLLQRSKAATRWLSTLGQHSLAIMVIHMLVIKSAQVVLAALLGLSFHTLMTEVRWGALVLLVVALALVPLVWVMENWLAATLGKRQGFPDHG